MSPAGMSRLIDAARWSPRLYLLPTMREEKLDAVSFRKPNVSCVPTSMPSLGVNLAIRKKLVRLSGVLVSVLRMPTLIAL